MYVHVCIHNHIHVAVFQYFVVLVWNDQDEATIICAADRQEKLTFPRLPKTYLRLQLMQINQDQNKVHTCIRNMYNVSMKHLQCIGGAILSLFPHSAGHHPTSTNKYTTCTCVPIHVCQASLCKHYQVIWTYPHYAVVHVHVHSKR